MLSSIDYLDLIGVASCALAGSSLAFEKKFDIIGIYIVAIINAIGGGTIRDSIILNREPFWRSGSELIFIVILICSILVFFDLKYLHKKWMKHIFNVADSIGLAYFTLTGTMIAMSVTDGWLVPIVAGAITGVAGGVMRDILCQRTPVIFTREIYLSISVVGALIYYFMSKIEGASFLPHVSTVVFIVAVRNLSLIYDIHLPNFVRLRNNT